MDAIKIQRLSHKMYKANIPFLPSILYRYLNRRYNSSLSPLTEIGEGTKLGYGGIGVVIHAKAKIGRNVILAQNVTIASKNGGAPTLEDWSYVGANSIVLGGVRIGKNAYIGALSLVNKDVPDGAIVAGIPARILRMRTQEEVQKHHQWVMKQGGISFDE